VYSFFNGQDELCWIKEEAMEWALEAMEWAFAGAKALRKLMFEPP
jgi:hypothetical protein